MKNYKSSPQPLGGYMRNIFTIQGVMSDGTKYSVICYDSIKEAKRHFDKLTDCLSKEDIPELREYDITGNTPVKYVVTKTMSHATFKGYQWYYQLGEWLHLRDNGPQ